MDKKWVLPARQVGVDPYFDNSFPEFAVKNVWPLLKGHAKFVKYMPDEEMDLDRYPDRRWFWGVVCAILPEWSQSYLKEAKKQRRENKKQLPEAKIIQFSDRWKERIAFSDFKSTSKCIMSNGRPNSLRHFKFNHIIEYKR